MDDVDQSIASQNAIVLAIGGKLKTLRAGIATSKQKGENTLLTEVTPIVKGINKNLDIIRKMLDEAKNIKKAWATAKNQLDTLGTEKAATSAALTKKDEEIAVLNTRLKENEAKAVANDERLTQQKIALEAAKQANVNAKEKAEASLRDLQQQSAAATQQQQAELQMALQGKTAAEEMQRRATQELADTKTDLGTSQQHAAKMQAHMAKLGDLKKHQAGLTAALNALNAEIEAANDEMLSLDAAHVDHLGAIKTQLQTLDEELRKIIEADPGAAGSGGPGPGMGPGSGAAGSGDRSTEADRRRAAILATDMRPGSGAAGSGDSQRRTLSRSVPHVNQGDFDNIDTNTDDEGGIDISRSSQPAAGGDNFVSGEVRRINTGAQSNRRPFTVNPDPVRDTLIHNQERPQQEQPHRSRGRFNLGDVPMKDKRGGTRRRQRGGYIAVKKTRSKSSSSSGRRGTRRSSSSRSKSTRRRRHHSSSSSSRR
jgi:hypothetical protein